jgi:hypothetical protein
MSAQHMQLFSHSLAVTSIMENPWATARVQRIDGAIHVVPVCRLVNNAALVVWSENRETTLRECNHQLCNVIQCRSVHFAQKGPTSTALDQSRNFISSYHPAPDAGRTTEPLTNAWEPSHTNVPPAARLFVSDGRASRTCTICCQPLLQGVKFYSCDERHDTCGQCLANYVITNWRDNCKATSGELRCCQSGCTSRPITARQFVLHVASKEALEVYIDHTNRQTAAQCFAEAHAIVLHEAPEATAAADALLQKQLQKAMSAARMCPHCKFGPIDFFGCDDLAYHHEEEADGGVYTDNSCQRCGYFAKDIASWERWDGVARKYDEPVARWSGESKTDDDDDDDTSSDDSSGFYTFHRAQYSSVSF